MKYFCLISSISILFFTPIQNTSAQSAQVDHLVAFARLSGGVQFFSPSDAANNSIWWRVYPNAVKSVMNAPDESAFVDTLVSIFQPIEPGLSIRYNNQVYLAGEVEHEPKPLTVTTQHRGLDLWSGEYRLFRSIRTNRRSLTAPSDMLETRVGGIPIPLDTLDKPFEASFHYQGGGIPMEVTVSRGRELLYQNSLDMADSVFTFRDTLQRSVRSVAFKIYTDTDKGFSVAFDTLRARRSYDAKRAGLVGTDSTEYVVEFFGNDLPLYEEKHQIGDVLDIQLNDNINASLPLAVYADKGHTFPVSDAAKNGYRFDTNVPESDGGLSLDNIHLRIANVIQVWNALRLSYAYLTMDDQQLDQVLSETLKACLNNISLKEYHKAVWSMLSKFEDSHIFFSIDEIEASRTHSVPLSVFDIGGRVYVKKVNDPALEGVFAAGDELMSLDGTPIHEVVDSLYAFTSGADRHRKWLAVHRSLQGSENSDVAMRVRKASTGREIDVTAVRSTPRDGYPEGISLVETRGNRFITPSVYYFDLTTAVDLNDTLVNVIKNPEMSLIVDMRGYGLSSTVPYFIVENLLADTVITENMFMPRIHGPGEIEWVDRFNVYEPHPERGGESAKVIFLTDVSAMSGPETILDIIKTFGLGTIIGQPTAGANGNINALYLPGGMSVSFSGLKVINSDGSQHHLIGVLPDYYVDYSYEDILTGNDPFVEKALDIIESDEAVD